VDCKKLADLFSLAAKSILKQKVNYETQKLFAAAYAGILPVCICPKAGNQLTLHLHREKR
jgi:hypothetical protein